MRIDDENENIPIFENPEEGDGKEYCEVFDAVMSVSMMPKPFGFIWDLEKIKGFLIKRGYKILKKEMDSGEEFEIAVKPDNPCIPEGFDSNVRSVFDSEVQDIILNWLLKNA